MEGRTGLVLGRYSGVGGMTTARILHYITNKILSASMVITLASYLGDAAFECWPQGHVTLKIL